MKTYCIEFKRELEDFQYLFVACYVKPSFDEAIDLIRENGFEFNEKYDHVESIYRPNIPQK